MTSAPVSPLRQRMIDDMRLRQYGEKTQHDYVREVAAFAKFLGRSPDQAEPEDLRRYQLHLAAQGASPGRMNLAVSALRFFFQVTLCRSGFGARLARPRKDQRLPVVLSPEEVALLLHCAPSLKHKAALSIAYGCGLRVSENRHGLAVDGTLTLATGTAEREAALAMLDRRPSRRRITLGADKAYDVHDFIGDLRARRVTPHVAVDGHLSPKGVPRSTAVDRRTRRHPGYEVSQRCRKRIEEVFGWTKAAAGLRKIKLRGRRKVEAAFTLGLAAYNLIRLPKLLAAPA